MPQMRPKSPKATIIVGLAFLALGLLALPIALGDPSETTRLGIPLWFVIIGIWAGGLFFVGLGWFYARRSGR